MEPVLQNTHTQRLMLEYDDERSGSFDVLASVPKEKNVVLGLVTTKHARDKSQDELIAQIAEAAKYFPLEQLGISPQCGFASSILGNDLSFEEQRKKLEVVATTAHRVWG